MSEVKITNARRIGFTALAVVVLVFVVQSAYREALGFWLNVAHPSTGFPPPDPKSWSLMKWDPSYVEGWRSTFWRDAWWQILCLALLPILLLVVAERNTPWKALRDVRLLVASALITCTIVGAVLLGGHNWTPVWTGAEWSAMINSHGGEDAARESHRISTLWLLLPIILTTAFVIFGAWRRAVRDAEVEAVGEDG